MKYFLKDASIVVTTLLCLFLVMATLKQSLPLVAILLGASVGLTTAATRAYRRTLEDRANAARKARGSR